MRTRSKLLLAALTATVFMTFAVSAAQARRLWLSNTRYLAIWTLLRFEVEGVATVECPVTLEGSFHSASITKISGLLIGYVTSAKVRGGRPECNNTGTARINAETLPWHVQYLGFTGVLPNIRSIRLILVGADFSIDPEGALLPNCRARTTQAAPGVGFAETAGTGPNFTITRLTAEPGSKIPLGGGFCEIAGEGDFRGSAEVFLQGSTTTRILVRLIA